MSAGVEPTGVVLQMQDYSIHDGNGVRTTIFLAGCSLRCQWCSNPESWQQKPKLAYYAHKCKGCLSCVASCPAKLDPRSMAESLAVCKDCHLCVSACPQKALAKSGKQLDVEAVYQKIKRDELFFRYTEGGVTFSGGEPFLQPEFLSAIIKRCEPLGVSFWAETCGHFSWSKAAPLLPHFEHLFFDLKHMDSERHRQYIGVGNEVILKNLKRIYQMGIPLTIRIPFIPEVNGDDVNIDQTAQFMQQHLSGCPVELLPYHELGKAKYTAFKMNEDFHAFSVPTEEQLNHAYQIFSEYGVAQVEH